MSIFSDNLRILRVKSGFKQTEIAEIVGVKASNWSNYEIGRSEPSIDVIVKIANTLKVNIETLLSHDLSPGPDKLRNDNANKLDHVKKDSARVRTTGLAANDHHESQKNPESLIATLKELVIAKNDIIAYLKTRIEDLENALKAHDHA